jgi:hypothetical protein
MSLLCGSLETRESIRRAHLNTPAMRVADSKLIFRRGISEIRRLLEAHKCLREFPSMVTQPGFTTRPQSNIMTTDNDFRNIRGSEIARV